MKERIPYLLNGWMQKKLTEEEELEWNRLLNDETLNEAFKDALDEAWFTKELNDKMREEAAGEIFSRITGAKVIAMQRRMSWVKWAAAACILLVTGYVLWVTSIRKPESGGQKTEVAKTNDIPAPSNTRAVITLADGNKVYLDSAGNGILAQQNNVAVVKNEKGEIIYSPDHQITTSQIAYNTLSNPRGSKVISLTLSDGTKVWLNSESSLRYPASFASSAVRDVEITGEAYFEVKHNSKQPFKVHLPNGSIVEDIGTAFNINSYADEGNIKTTLVEGSVKITNTISNSSASSVTLRPGEQSTQSISNRVIRVLNNVDIEQVTAWKNGLFKFNRADVKTVMQQIARWYDMDVEYRDNVDQHFGGTISRNVNASKVFEMLEMTGGVKFKIDGKKVIVLK